MLLRRSFFSKTGTCMVWLGWVGGDHSGAFWGGWVDTLGCLARIEYCIISIVVLVFVVSIIPNDQS